MTTPQSSRYRRVSRRAMLKASLGAGMLATATACGDRDADVFAGATADTLATTSTTATTPPTTTTADTSAEQTFDESTTTEDSSLPGDAAASALSEKGEMVIAFTYTRSAGGKIESPYVAVWIENEAGDLAETVALFYQQDRRGARWLDHLDRWFSGDAARIASGGDDVAATISSATRPPGEYAVAWDGTIDGEPAAAGTYSVYVEAAREDGPVSLTGTTVTLDGSPRAVSLPDNGELSLASVRVDG